MDYKGALEYIHNTNKFGIKLGLENIGQLLNYMGNPHKQLKFIHIAGTNGKGSTSNMISNILIEAGYKVGLFISPYIEKFTERIQVNKEQISKEDLTQITAFVKKNIENMVKDGHQHPTEFEIVTAIGFQYFYEQEVNFVVLEVGMGGRFDATNIIENSLVSIITSISIDHIQYLGNSIEKIAFEKAGIIKKNGIVIVYPQDKNIIDVITEVADNKNAKVITIQKNDIKLLSSNINGQELIYNRKNSCLKGEYKLSLLGLHQLYNCLTALTSIDCLIEKGYSITNTAVSTGLANTKFSGRFEIFNNNPLIIIDGAHNLDGIKKFSDTIKYYFPNKKINIFLGILSDKEKEKMIDEILPISKKIITITPESNRAINAKALAQLIKKRSDFDIEILTCNDMSKIKNHINYKDKKEIYAFIGSLYLIGQIKANLN